ncbi:MAG: hypothetical protein AABZ15_13525 [Nitrospirota bacterium]
MGELDKLRELKNDFELKLKELIATQSEVKNKLSSIATINEEQNIKIKNLEMKEKINVLISKNEYQRALEYIAIGLDVQKNDVELLSSKVACLLRLGNHRDAIDAINRILIIDSNNQYHVETLAELYLFTESIDNYNDLVKNKKDVFNVEEEPLIEYLEALKHYVKNDTEGLKTVIKACVNKYSLTDTTCLLAWDFRDVRLFARSRKDDVAKKILLSFTKYLDGKLSGEDLLKLLE